MSSTEISTSSFSFRSAISCQRHDVFLSFRGEDTRHSVTAELHRALSEAGVPTFKDDVNLEKGTDIASELLKAIQTSRVSVIVFSRNYATSGWCLDELVKIVECSKVDGQVVVPVFCDVSADDVYGQKGSFESAFRRHEERLGASSGQLEGCGIENKVGKWRSALMEAAASSPAWDLQNNVSQWQRSRFIQEIVKQVSYRRQDAHMSLNLQPPKIDDAKENLNLLLSVISDDVLVVGVYGADKLSRTGIAKAVYNRNFLRFEGSSFLANVSASSKQPNGLILLQEQLLSDVLMDSDDIKIEDVNKGINMIKTVLQSRRVLIVLDGVDKLEQLNALARKRNWFGAGSRVIITTGDANLLSVLESDDVYGPNGIQVIKEKHRQNLQMSEVLKEHIQKLHFQGQKREESLIAEIERERKKNAYQAQILASLQQGQDKVPPSDALATTSDAVLNGSDPCDFDSNYWTFLEAKLAKEMKILDSFLRDEERGRIPCIEAENKDMLKAEVETKALAVLPGHIYGEKHHSPPTYP